MTGNSRGLYRVDLSSDPARKCFNLIKGPPVYLSRVWKMKLLRTMILDLKHHLGKDAQRPKTTLKFEIFNTSLYSSNTILLVVRNKDYSH